MMQCRHRRWLVASLLCAAVGGAAASALFTPPAGAQLAGDAVAGDVEESADTGAAAQAPAGISIPDSPAAIDLLQKAADKERQHQWAAAADDYQQVLGNYAARVVPVRIDPENGIFRYQGVALVAAERLARWPDEGQAVYRAAMEPKAADALAAAGPRDAAALESIFWNYFPTEAGKSAGIALLDLDLEAGRFAAAAFVGQRLLDLHPTLIAERPAVLFRTAVACHDGGEDGRANKLRDELASKFPNAVGHIGNKDVVLADALASILRSPGPAPAMNPADADRWPLFGGPAGWGGVSPSAAQPGASITRIDLIPPSIGAIDPRRRQLYQQTDDSDLAQGQGLGIMPVVDGGAIFFQDGRHLYAVNPDSGRPLPGWEDTYPAAVPPAPVPPADADSPQTIRSTAGIYSVDALGRARGEQLTVTVTPRSVLALMNQRDRAAMIVAQIIVTGPGSGPKLVCLDRTTGRQQWTRSAADLPDSAGPVRNGEFIGSPLFVPGSLSGAAASASAVPPAAGSGDGTVLICAVGGGRDRAFTDIYVVALSASTGKFRYATYVGSATQSFDGEMGTDTIDTPQLALDQGRVLVLSNVGTVAAMEPADGRMLWLNTYPRNAIDTPEAAAVFLRARMMGANNPNAPAASVRPWTQSPVITEGGKAYVLPADGKDLLVYDIASGAELKRIATADYDNAQVLIGVRGGVAVMTSDKGCFAVDTAGYDAADPGKAVVWESTYITGDDDNAIFGRGFLTGDSVFIPTRNRLYQLSWRKGGKVMLMYPSQGVWSGGQEPGNVLVTSQNVIVAGSSSVEVYIDIDRVRRRYQAQIAAAPGDPAPRVALAQALFNAGQPDAALASLDQAIALLGGRNAMASGPARRLVYLASLDFSRHLAASATGSAGGSTGAGAGNGGASGPGSAPGSSIATADALFDRAAAAAESPAEQSGYRLARAAFDRDRHDYAGEVALCQQVLLDPAQRQVGGEQAASDIAAVLQVDPDAYAPVEKAAADALAAAGVAADPAALARVADAYPNAKAAIAAWEAAADLYESRGNFGDAVKMLRRVLSSAAFGAAGHTNTAEAARLETALARNFAAAPGDAGLAAGRAIDRLAAAIRWAGPDAPLAKPMVLPGGATVAAGTPLHVAVERLQQIEDRAAIARLPDFAIPATNWKESAFSTRDSPVIDHVTALLRPERRYARSDRVVTWSPRAPGGGVVAYAAGSAAALWTAGDFPDQPGGIAWNDGGAGAEGAWAVKASAKGGDAVPSRLAVWTDARLEQLDGDSGKVLWQFSIHDLSPVSAASDADVINDSGVSGSDADNLINNGQVVQFGRRPVRMLPGGVFRAFNNGVFLNANANANNAGGEERISRVQPAGDRLLMLTTTGQLVALDATDGRVAWQFRLDDRVPDALVSNDRFAVLRSDDGSGALLGVIDIASGRVIGRRRFGPSGTPTQLVNAALSEDATLVLTEVGKLLAKDLYEPWAVPPQELTTRANADATNFSGLDQPDQLLVHGGRVIALYDSGASVRVHDLCAANPSDERDPLSTGASGSSNLQGNNGDTPAPWLELVGSRLYALHSRSFAQYNLAAPADHYLADAYDGWDYPPHIRDAFIGKDDVVLLNQPIDRGPTAGAPFDLLLVYSRAPVSPAESRESGLLIDAQTVQDPSGILAWQSIDGGLCYLAADQRLHMLMGATRRAR